LPVNSNAIRSNYFSIFKHTPSFSAKSKQFYMKKGAKHNKQTPSNQVYNKYCRHALDSSATIPVSGWWGRKAWVWVPDDVAEDE
jgi:hypothetical protein